MNLMHREVFGEIALLDGQVPRHVTALDQCELL